MNLAPPSALQRHNGHPHGSAMPAAPAMATSDSSAFTFGTSTWQPDGFGFDATSGEFFTASPTALLVMQCLAENLTTPQILDRLTGTFDVTRRTAERDLEAFLVEVSHLGLIPTEN